MPTPPTSVPRWAYSAASGDIDEPPNPTKAAGWPSLLKPPHEWVNWWWNQVGEWLQFVSVTGRVFDDLTEAVDYADTNFSPGDMLVVFEDDNATGPGSIGATEDPGAASAIGGLDACGDLVAFSIAGFDNKGVNRDLTGAGASGSPIATYTRTNSGTNYAIKTNGTVTVQAYGNYVEAFNATTGASLWVFDMDGTPVADLCICAGFVYIVHGITTGGADATANRHMHKLSLATGAVAWSLQHTAAGGQLVSVCTNGRQVFAAGSVSSYATGANMRAINATDGKDATGECNNGTDGAGLAWDRVDATVHGSGRVMDCDGTMLYSGYPNSATNQLEAIGQANGVSVWVVAHPDSSASALHVSCDQDYVYMCTTDSGAPAHGYVEAYDKRTGALAWRWADATSASFPDAPMAAVSDGSAVFVILADTEGLYRISRGNVPTKMRFVNPASELVRYRNWKLQPESQ